VKLNLLQDDEYEMPPHCHYVVVTKFRLGPTEIHQTYPPFYMRFILFSAVCQPRGYSVLASEIFLLSLEWNLPP